VHAEQLLANAPEKTIAVSSRVSGKRVCIAIDYSDNSPDSGSDPFTDRGTGEALGLQVCQAVVQSHGGEIRLTRNLESGARFEIELPLDQQSRELSGEEPSASNRAGRPLTVLIVEPDAGARRKLLSILSDRGHRAVPVQTAEEAIELVQRLRFDITFSSVRLPGMNWVEFFEKIRRDIGAFVLVAEGSDSDLSRAFKGSDGYLLKRPIEESEAQRLLALIEERQESLAKT
jgi:CheY-like chemotaxis protein